MGRFETELLATDENVEALVDMNGVWIDKVCSAPGSLDTSLSHAAGLIEIAACHA